MCGGPILELFRAHELRLVVTGNEDYDWDVFENAATYKDGYTSSDPTVWLNLIKINYKSNCKFYLFDLDSLILGCFS